MYNLRKIASWFLFMFQFALVLWLGERSELDVFSQMILLPLLLISGLALLSLKTDL